MTTNIHAAEPHAARAAESTDTDEHPITRRRSIASSPAEARRTLGQVLTRSGSDLAGRSRRTEAATTERPRAAHAKSERAAHRRISRTSTRWLVPADVWGLVIVLAMYPGTLPGVAAAAVGVVATNHATGLYRNRFTEYVLDDLPRIVLGTGAGVAAGAIVGSIVGPGSVPRADRLALLLLLSGLVGRYAVYACRRVLSESDPRRAARVLVIGDGQEAVDLGRRIVEHPQPGVEPVGFLGDAERLKEGVLPKLGGYDDVEHVVERKDVSVVILAAPHVEEWRLAQIVRRQQERHLAVYSVPPGYSLGSQAGSGIDRIWGVPLVAVTPTRRAGGRWWIKRGLDILLSLFALLALLPVMVAVAVAVRLEIGPSIIFRQDRIGRDGYPFTLYKFTSLQPVDETESQTTWSVAHDDRIGPVGRFIRATSLDELPQLVNILRGDMSIVGPRPERPHFVDVYRKTYPGYDDRHRAPAGLTGYAAVHGLRGDTSIQDRAQFDNTYIDSWSLWQDVKIIVRTVSSVVGKHGG